MEFTLEQEADIRASYRDAKNPQKQIDILADLYACKKNDILEVLCLKQSTRAKRTPRTYGPETKKKVLDAVLSGQMTQPQAADEFDVLIGTVAKWVQIARKELAESSAPAEPEPVPAAVLQPLSEAAQLKIDAMLKEMQSGLEGLCNFYDAFYGYTAICEEWGRIDTLILRAEGFLGGLEAAAELMKDEKGV